MGLDIYIDVANREARDEVVAKNQEIRKRNDKVYEEQGDVAELEEPIDIPCTQEYYFRKFNALVEWIENNVGALENCEPLELGEDDIEGLQATLNDLTPENCDVELPTCTGFFFGSQEYDDWYWENVEKAKQMCNDILEKTDWEKDVVTILIWY